MKSVDELAAKLKEDVGKWEELIFDRVSWLAQDVARGLLEGIDKG